MITNYKDFKKFLQTQNKENKLLLHSCCAPCSTHTILLLNQHFKLTVFFDNHNIQPDEEYQKRLNEQKKLCRELNIDIVDTEYDTQQYFNAVKGYEHLPEFSMRCYQCYKFRLINTFNYANTHDFDFFTTTLSISPYKNTKYINEIGYSLENDNTKFLYSNFKKDMGYQNSIKLSNEFDLYRQHYCGCVFSKKEFEIKEKLKIKELTDEV